MEEQPIGQRPVFRFMGLEIWKDAIALADVPSGPEAHPR
jgi:hypothetical protein